MRVLEALKRALWWDGPEPPDPIPEPPSTEVILVDGNPWRVHAAWICLDRQLPCVFHSPSDHSMRSWPMHLRASGLVERICDDHGIGHPDPDSAAFLNSAGPEGARGTWGIHGCDGCCRAT